MKKRILPLISASLFSLCLASVSMAGTVDLSENFTSTSDTSLDDFLVPSDYLTLTGNKYSIIGNNDADINYLGFKQTKWLDSTISGIGDINNLGFEYDELSGDFSYTSQGFVGYAGALYFLASVNISDSVFTDNVLSSNANYSALYIKKGSVDNSAFIANSGGYTIFNDNSKAETTTTISNSYFYGNQLGIYIQYSGGGVYVEDTLFKANQAVNSTDWFIRNTAKSILGISDSTFTNNTGYQYLITNECNAHDISTLSVSNSTFTGNTNDGNTSVALYLKSNTGTASVLDDGGVATDETYTVYYSALTTVTGSTFENGNSAIYSTDYGDITVTDSKFLNNTTANAYLIVSSGGILNISGSEFTGNSSVSISTDYIVGASDYLNISDTTFSNNTGYNIVVYADSNNWNAVDAKLDNVTFENNTTGVEAYIDPDTGDNIAATNGTSVALNVNSTTYGDIINVATAEVKNSTFKGNDSSITMDSNSVLTVDNTVFEGNGNTSVESSVINAKNAINASITLTNSTIDGNTSKNGVIYSVYDSTNIYVENCDFTNNIGGYGVTFNVMSATVVDSTFMGNSGTSGGVFYIVPSSADINSEITISAVNEDIKSYNNTSNNSAGYILMATGDADDRTATVNFDIADGRTMEIGNYTEDTDQIKSYAITNTGQTINKIGDGSLIVNSAMSSYYGDLYVQDGSMYINKGIGSSLIEVSEGATAMIRLNSSTFANSSSLEINNYGNIILSGTIGGSGTKWVYKDVSVSTYNDYGTTTVYGGTFDSTTGAYVTSTVISVLNNSIISSTIAQNGIVRYSDSDSNILMELQLNSATELSISNIDIGNTALISAYYTINGLTLGDGDSALVSFLIDDATLSLADLNIYELQNDEWVVINDSLEYLQYDGQYLSFITDDLSNSIGWGYVTAVPEPSTYAAIAGALALGLAMYRRRR